MCNQLFSYLLYLILIYFGLTFIEEDDDNESEYSDEEAGGKKLVRKRDLKGKSHL